MKLPQYSIKQEKRVNMKSENTANSTNFGEVKILKEANRRLLYIAKLTATTLYSHVRKAHSITMNIMNTKPSKNKKLPKTGSLSVNLQVQNSNLLLEDFQILSELTEV